MDSVKISPANWEEMSNTIHGNFLRNTSIAPGSFEEVKFLALALGGEVGELQNLVKKIWRDGKSADLYTELFKEVADVTIYLHHLTKALGLSHGVICADKTQENFNRWNDGSNLGKKDNPRG